MRLCILPSIFAVRPFDHRSASALLRNVVITAQCKRSAYICQRVAYIHQWSFAPRIEPADCDIELMFAAKRDRAVRISNGEIHSAADSRPTCASRKCLLGRHRRKLETLLARVILASSRPHRSFIRGILSRRN